MAKPYAIILGAGVRPDGTATPTLRRRAERAADLFLRGDLAGIVATGAAKAGAVSEAAAASDVLVGRGVAEDAILRDEHSMTTRENIAHAIRMLPEGTETVLVSDAWHLPRARLIAWRLGHPARGVAASTAGTSLPGTARLILREALALVWELLRPVGKG